MADFDTEDIRFREVDGQNLLGRLYRPRKREPFPLLIDVHGGVWVTGDRLNNAVLHEALASDGIGVFAIDFRMPPVARYPAAAADVNFGIRWLKSHAERLGTRPGLVGGLGTSSGGHLLMLNALCPNDARYASDSPCAGSDGVLGYAVACWPILDPLARFRMAKAKGLQAIVKGHEDFWPDEEAMALANPQLILERGEWHHLPEVLLIQGTNDENVEPHRADLFASRYRAADGAITLVKYEGEPHAFMLKDPTSRNSMDGLRTMREFILSRAK